MGNSFSSLVEIAGVVAIGLFVLIAVLGANVINTANQSTASSIQSVSSTVGSTLQTSGGQEILKAGASIIPFLFI